MMITPPPRCFRAGPGGGGPGLGGNGFSPTPPCHSASVVPSRSDPAARPTLLTRMSRPPKVSTALPITNSMPAAVDTSACAVAIMFGRFAAASTSSAASASCSAPRAQRHTRHPSATRERALARPSPRLDPVTTATLSVSPKSITWRSRRSFDSSAGQVVEAPVHLLENEAEFVLLHELFLEREQVGPDERDHRALDRRPLRKDRIRLVGIGGHELGFAPAQDRRDEDLVREAVGSIEVPVGDELDLDLGELFLETLRGVGLAAQAAAADGAAAEREEQPRILEPGQDRLLDLVERHRASGRTEGVAIEGTGDLLDGGLQRIVVDHRLQHERVVGVHPEGDLLPVRPPLVSRRRHVERRDVAIETAALAFERAIVDEAVTHVDIEDLVERPVQQFRARRWGELLSGDRRTSQQEGKREHDAAHGLDHSAERRKSSSARENAAGCSRLERCPASGIIVNRDRRSARCMASASATGTMASPSDAMTRAAHVTRARSGVESGRSISAPIAPSMPADDVDSIVCRTNATVSGSAADDSKFGSTWSATAGGPLSASRARSCMRPSRACGVSAIDRVLASSIPVNRPGARRCIANVTYPPIDDRPIHASSISSASISANTSAA